MTYCTSSGRGAEFLAQRFVQVFEDVQAGVEADEVNQFERTHGMVEAELEGLVDVCGGGDAFLQHVEGFVADDGVDAAGDESGGFFDDDDFLAHALADFDGGGDGVVVGFEGAHDFQQLHLVDGIEEVHADALGAR